MKPERDEKPGEPLKPAFDGVAAAGRGPAVRGQRAVGPPQVQPLMTELLILADGGILVHNLTPTMAAILQELNPEDATIRPRSGTTAEQTNLMPNKIP